ncbi:MAG TPA: flagellar biosynthetic protein FliO [Terracidiphilus sp.]|nr:flagellar biosynthetic protein FliO [Terracidiphilus sp.]
MKQESKAERQLSSEQAGLAAWLLKRVLGRLRGGERRLPRLALVERIALAPRQSLALVEAEGRRFLVATSQEGGPAFYALDRAARPAPNHRARVSW